MDLNQAQEALEAIESLIDAEDWTSATTALHALLDESNDTIQAALEDRLSAVKGQIERAAAIPAPSEIDAFFAGIDVAGEEPESVELESSARTKGEEEVPKAPADDIFDLDAFIDLPEEEVSKSLLKESAEAPLPSRDSVETEDLGIDDGRRGSDDVDEEVVIAKEDLGLMSNAYTSEATPDPVSQPVAKAPSPSSPTAMSLDDLPELDALAPLDSVATTVDPSPTSSPLEDALESLEDAEDALAPPGAGASDSGRPTTPEDTATLDDADLPSLEDALAPADGNDFPDAEEALAPTGGSSEQPSSTSSPLEDSERANDVEVVMRRSDATVEDPEVAADRRRRAGPPGKRKRISPMLLPVVAALLLLGTAFIWYSSRLANPAIDASGEGFMPSRKEERATLENFTTAITQGNPAFVEYLLRQVPDFASWEDRSTLLVNQAIRLLADAEGEAAANRTFVLRDLLDAGAILNAPDSEGLLPIEIAIESNNAFVIGYLLDRNASATERSLLTAIEREDLDLLDQLFDHWDGPAPASVLEAALELDFPEVLLRVLETKPDVQQQFEIAVREGNLDRAVLLLEHGAKIVPKSGLLQAAVRDADLSMIDFLLEAGADPLARDAKGKSSIDLVVDIQRDVTATIDPETLATIAARLRPTTTTQLVESAQIGQQSPISATAAYQIRFSDDWSAGTLYSRANAGDRWDKLGEARGIVTLSAGKQYRFDAQLVRSDDFKGLWEKSANVFHTLSLHGPAVVDSTARQFKDFTALRVLEFIDTGITDNTIEELSGLENLETLRIIATTKEQHRINGTGLVGLRRMTKLRELDLSGATITNLGIAHLERVQSLEVVNIAGTRVSDRGLYVMRRLPKLRTLHVSLSPTQGTNATGPGLVNLGDLEAIKEISLVGIELTKSSYDTFDRFPVIERMNLEGCSVSDAWVPRLAALKTLKYLNLKNNPISEAGLKALQNALPACEINVN